MKSIRDILSKTKKKSEPVFILRAQDKCALIAIKQYYDECNYMGCNPEFLDEIDQIIEDFETYKKNHVTKIPD